MIMANPYRNDITNLRSNMPGSSENSPMKQPMSGMNYSQPYSSGIPPPPLPGQVHPQRPTGFHHSSAPSQWNAGHPPNPPSMTGANANGFVPPGEGLRDSPRLPRPPPNSYSPNLHSNVAGYPPLERFSPAAGQHSPRPQMVPHSTHANSIGQPPPISYSFRPPSSTPPLTSTHTVPPLRQGINQPGASPLTAHHGAPLTGSINHASGIRPPTFPNQYSSHALPTQPPMYGTDTPHSTGLAGPQMTPPPLNSANAPPSTNSMFGRMAPGPPLMHPQSGAPVSQTMNTISGRNPPRYPPSVNTITRPPMMGQPQVPPQPGGNQMPPMMQGVNPTNQMLSGSLAPPSAPGQFPYPSMPGITQGMGSMGINDKFRPIDILQEKRLVPQKKHYQKPLRFEIGPGDRGMIPPNRKNCNPEVFRCTLNAIPVTQALLNKVKLPLGLIVHPFKDLSSLPVISAGTIVRCKRCRTYINPFVDFLDERRWRCNLCFVVNEVPEEFLHHPVTKTYGEPHTRPECTNSTLEFIAPQEYMVRPPQPAVYMFFFDVSHAAVETGYLQIVCDALLEHIDHLPGDSRTKIGFMTYNGTVQFYRMAEGSAQPQMMIVTDLDDIFLPTPDSLLVNLKERKDLVCDLLRQLPELHQPPDNLSRGEIETQSALGAALQAAHKMMAPFGGRVTIFQQTMPTTGPGALKPRENPNTRAGDASTQSLNPSTDFYKKLALDCSANQIAMDFFFMNSQYIDIATLSCTSRFSAGDLHYYPGLHVTHNPLQAERLARDLDRYLTRKIGFEAVMRIRCTKGLAIHTFHGNFFVRSTDLLALANINPDAGFGLNISIEESLTDLSSVCIQAALLYTSSKGERRIRVHTMCFPVAKQIIEVFNAVDSDAVVSLLSKMAVDRSVTASISDARDALVNAVIDALKAYKEAVNPGSVDLSLLVPPCMKTFPLAISCLLKHPALRGGVSTRLDDRVFSMIDLKMQPTLYALQSIHPDLYRIDDLRDEGGLDIDERIVPQPPLLPLSAESINRDGVYLLDTGWHLFLRVGPYTSREFLQNVMGVKQFSDIEQPMYSLPDLDNPQSEGVHNFIEWLQDQRPHHAPLQVVRADSREHYFFMLYMRQDKTEASMSFQEFLQHIKQQMIK